MKERAQLARVTPLIGTGATMAEALDFYVGQMGFAIMWEGGGMAGIERDGVAFNLIENSSREWLDNSSFSIGVTDLEALYEEYRGIAARVGALEQKAWGRREFHMIVPSGICFQFYQAPVPA